MRTIAALLTAALLGLASPTFAAETSDAQARETRMAAALSDFRQQQPALAMPAGDPMAPAHHKHHRKSHHAVKPSATPAQ